MSHLLTHVASKAHLSCEFHLKVSRFQDPMAVELLAEYDQWYKDNGLEQLLFERMTSKGKKKRSQRRASNGTKAQPIKQEFQPFSPEPTLLDPGLVDSSEDAHHELESMETSPNEKYPPIAAPTGTNAISASSEEVAQPSKQSSNTLESHGWVQTDGRACDPGPTVPVTSKRRRSKRLKAQGLLPSSEATSDPFVDRIGCAAVLDNAEIDKERADEIARLKGVLWPGMDVFDSATQKMRRKRNQKKNEKELEMMEATSMCVEPAELIFSPTGTFQKQREITGSVEDDSPLKGETPPPMPPRPRRGVLRQADPNVPRRERKRARKTSHQDRDREEEELVEQNPGTPLSTRRPKDLAYSYAGYDGELGMSIQAFGRKRRNAFTVFTDAGSRGDSKDQHAGTKLQRDTLTPARLVLDRQADITSRSGTAADHVSLEKENIEPILNPQGRIGLPTWLSPFPKHRDSNDAEYVPSYFYEEPGVGLATYDDHDRYGYRCNPLLAPTPKQPLIENRRPDATSDHGAWQPVSRADDSEATISDEDMDKLYLEDSDN